MITKKTVDIEANSQIYIFGPPQKGIFMNIELSVGDILTAIRQGAYVYETNKQGQRIRLNADNYNLELDVPVTVEEIPVVELKPVAADVIDPVSDLEETKEEEEITPEVTDDTIAEEDVKEEVTPEVSEESVVEVTEDVKEVAPVVEKPAFTSKKYRNEKRN